MRRLITGGIKSGKSRFALELARNWEGEVSFIATATHSDEEMSERIRRHQRERRELSGHACFVTRETGIDIESAAREAPAQIVLDCLTLWMGSVYGCNPIPQWQEMLDRFLQIARGELIVVTNEVGLGNIPPDSATRAYNEALGEANRRVAQAVDEVYFMVAGLPMKIKG